MQTFYSNNNFNIFIISDIKHIVKYLPSFPRKLKTWLITKMINIKNMEEKLQYMTNIITYKKFYCKLFYL